MITQNVFCLILNQLLPTTSIERFHMTSRQPYWCSKSMKRRPCWFTQKILCEFNSFHVNDFFCSNKLAQMLATWVKTLYSKWIGVTKENFKFDLKVQKVKERIEMQNVWQWFWACFARLSAFQHKRKGKGKFNNTSLKLSLRDQFVFTVLSLQYRACPRIARVLRSTLARDILHAARSIITNVLSSLSWDHVCTRALHFHLKGILLI